MNKKSSGTYVIDSEYNIISCNQTAMETYPQLKKGEKCYKCLMGLDAPCPPCPVLNQIQGPQTYMDPIRNIRETVDSVEMLLDDGTVGHALIFSTVDENEKYSRMLPTNEEEFKTLFEQEFYDKVTGGYSRDGFIRETSRILETVPDVSEFAIFLFDIKNFKAINESFGIHGGDELLRSVYRFLEKSAMEPLVTARIEADRLVCLIKKKKLELDDFEDMLNMAWNYRGRVIRIHFRCGIYFLEDKSTPVSTMIDRAVMAKQFAVAEKRSSYAVFDQFMRKEYVGRAEILSDFDKSLQNKEFEVYYQPVVDAMSGRVISAEALVRWNHPDLGFISPGQFVPVLEKNGLITQLDSYVIDQVFDWVHRRLEKGLCQIPVSINLSWQDFYDDGLMNSILQRLGDENLPTEAINFEVTETSIATMEENCSYLLEQMRRSGARILLDDFGSGYSSFGMIRNYSFDIIKIDRGFVRQIEDNLKVRNIIAAIINMSHRIGLQVVAEGVENEEQLNYLKDQGCDFIQGYYFSKPLCEKDFRNYLWQRCKQEGRSCFRQRVIAHGNEADTYEPEEWEDPNFLSAILDHSDQFIQVCDSKNYTMLYANHVTRAISVDPEKPYKGEKCYEYMLGLDAPCGHCPMRMMGDETERKLEVDDGQHAFGLTAKYMEWKGRKVFIEYGRDITELKRARHQYHEQMKTILESIPEEQGVFHVDLTDDKWISSGGNAENARAMQNVEDVDTLIRQIGSFVPNEEGQLHFFDTFSRAALLKAHEEGRRKIQLDTLSYYDDRSIRWSRIVACLIQNPETRHLECLIYGVDITKEKEREKMENYSTEIKHLKSESEKKVQEVMEKYSKADRDRRMDFLTGLRNRLDLFEIMKSSLAGKEPPIETMFMLDIDDFKNINDKYGHVVGDQCLRAIGHALHSFGQEHNMIFFRYGGEEFLGISFAKQNNVEEIAAELLKLVRGLKIVLNEKEALDMTVSLGYTAQNQRYEKMIDLADRAMYRAKRMGKDCFACFETM